VYYVFRDSNKFYDGKPVAADATVKAFDKAQDAINYAKHRCRITGGDYRIAGDHGFVHQAPVLLDITP
jgi:hypothetical protein